MATSDNQQLAEKWKTRFEKSELNQKPLFEAAAKYYDIMYAVMSTTNMAPWRSKVYVPILASKGWDLIARFSDINPVFDVEVKNEVELDEETNELNYTTQANEAIEKIQQLMQDEFKNATGEPMSMRVFDTLLDAVVPGTGYAKTPWLFEEKKSYARKFGDDGMTLDDKNVIVKTVKQGHNDFDPINFFNMFIAPRSKSFFKAPYHIVREYSTVDEAKATGLYEDAQLDKLAQGVSESDTFITYNRSRNHLVNGKETSDDETIKKIVLYECYEGGNMVTFGEGEGESGWVKLREEEDMYWHGRVPIVPFYIRRKSFSPYGESLFENNARLQNAVNDLFNHYLDNWNLAIDQMLIYEDGSVTNDYVIEPGGEITYKQGFAQPQQFKISDPNPNQLTAVLDIINQGIEQATVPQYLSGVPDSNLDKTAGTATGINTITEAATEKVGFMRNNLKASMKLVGQNWLSNLQQYMDLPREVSISKNGMRRPVIITPGDLQREIEIDIDDDSMRPTTKQQKREATQQFAADLLTFQKAAVVQSKLFNTPEDIPRFDFTEMIEDTAHGLSIKDFNKYLKPNTLKEQGVQATDDPNAVDQNGVPVAAGGAGTVQAAEEQEAAAGGVQ